MPTLSVMKVFVNLVNRSDNTNDYVWVQFEFADHSRSEVDILNIDDAIVNLAHNLDVPAWIALQKALQNPGNWIEVEGK